LIEYFIQKDRRGGGEVERIGAANHGNLDHDIAHGLKLGRNAFTLAAEQQDEGIRVVDVLVVGGGSGRGSDKEALPARLPGGKRGHICSYNSLVEECAHTCAHGGGIVRICGIANEDDAGAAHRLAGPEDRAEIARRAHRFGGDPA